MTDRVQQVDGPIKREPDLITDHPYAPRTRPDGTVYWWDLCETCHLAQPAHATKATSDG
jgi:hypothetical protein